MTDEYQSAIDRCKAAREQFDAAFDEVKRLRPDESSTKEAREAEYDAHVQWILDYERGLLPEQEKVMWPDEGSTMTGRGSSAVALPHLSRAV